MDNDTILRTINETAVSFFGNPSLQLTRDTTAADVDGWDSLAHIQFLMELENAFGVRFKSSEVSAFANVGQLADRIALKREN